MPIPLKKINIIPGKFYYHKFKLNDGSFLEIETSQYEYSNIKENGKPNHIGGTWICSYETIKTDSKSGRIDVGTYAVMDGRAILNIDGTVKVIPSEFIINDTLNDDGIIKASKNI